MRARDAGMDVVYEGIRLTPARIARTAVDEGVHVVGLSILSGSHAELIPSVLAELRDAGADVPVVVGGIIPPADEAALLEAGVARVYTPKDFEVSRIMGDIVDLVAAHHGVAARRSRPFTHVTPPSAAPWDAAIAVTKEAQHVTATHGRANVLSFRSMCEIAALADRQHGVVALRPAAVSSASVQERPHRARARPDLHRIHRAVYAVGRSKLTGRGHWMAAVLACGAEGRPLPPLRRGPLGPPARQPPQERHLLTQPLGQGQDRRSRYTAA